MPSRPTLRRRRAGVRAVLVAGAWVLGSALTFGARLVLLPGAMYPLLVATVVRVHGGSWSAGQRGAPAWGSALASARAVVVEVDYRLTGAVAGEPWRAQPRDVARVTARAGTHAERPGVDPARIVLPGDGVLDLVGARPDDAPAAYRAASPLTYVGPGVPPTPVVHGDHDQVVPVEQSRELVAALERAGAEHACVELPFADHGFDQVWGAVTTRSARAAVLRWLARA